MNNAAYYKRRRIWKAANRARSSYVKKINNLWRRAIRNYVEGKDDFAIAEAMRITYVEVGGRFARRQYNKLIGKKALGDIEDDLDQLMANYARSQMGDITKSIQDTSAALYARIGALEDLTNDEIIKKLDKMIIERAKIVTQNEIVRASNVGQEIGADAAITIASSSYVKTWIATIDAVVRDAHADADGQVARGHEFFTVGSDALRYPGDPSGSVENTINCRCVLDYQEIESN